MRKLLLFFLLLLCGQPAVMAQSSRPMRLEFQVSADQRPYRIVPIGSKGMLLIYKTIDEKTGNKQKWIFSQYDVNFKKGWTQDFVPETESAYRADVLKDGIITVLFIPSEKKVSNPLYSLVSIDIAKGTLTSQTGTIPDKAIFNTMEVMGKTCMLSFLNANRQAQYLFTNLKTGKMGTLIPEEKGRSLPKTIFGDTTSKTYIIVYELFTEKKASVYCILRCDTNLTTLSKTTLDLKADSKSLTNLKIFPWDSITSILVGTYSGNPEKDYDKARENTEENTGLFTAILQDTSIFRKNFYNLMEFKNFYKKFRANDIITSSASSDKKITSANYLSNLHEPFLLNKTCVIVMEAYYPEYHTVTNWVYDYYGHMVPTTTTVFDGYRYNNAFIAGIDSTASLKWSNTMEINNILTLDLSKKVNVLRDAENLVMSYSADGKIVSKVISGNESISGLDYASVEMLNTGDKLIDDTDSRMFYWYDNYLICQGTQEIRNSSKAEPRRTVFYVNKIAFR